MQNSLCSPVIFIMFKYLNIMIFVSKINIGNKYARIQMCLPKNYLKEIEKQIKWKAETFLVFFN